MICRSLIICCLALSLTTQAADYSNMVGSTLPSFDPASATSNSLNIAGDAGTLVSKARIDQIQRGLSEDLGSGEIATRGAGDIKAFNSLSPSVVLILAGDGSGSGSVIDKSGHVLTNWHVVGSEKTVDVIYRPRDVSREAYGERTYAARVLKVDQVSDLALVKIISPRKDVQPLSLATSQPMVGEDVSAIGHPLGFSWTYTKGIVTGVRDEHSWQYDTGFQHSAKVVQTQTPINPGNSGGPLFNENGEIIGVNSFASRGEATNFAVSADSVKDFLNRPDSRYAPRIPGTAAMADLSGNCDWKIVGESWVSDDEQHVLTGLDINCDGNLDAIAAEPRGSAAKRIEFDTNQDGYVDLTMIDIDNDGSWDLSFFDVDADGDTDVVGYHSEESGPTPVEFSSFARFQAMMNG